MKIDIDRLETLAVEMACVVDTLTAIHCAMAECDLAANIAADAVYAAEKHLARISAEMDSLINKAVAGGKA